MLIKFMNLNERISKVIEYSNLSSSEFADEIEVQRSSISHITSGRNKPSLDFLIKVKDKFPAIRWDWLILGEGEMLEDHAVYNSESKSETPSSSPTTDAGNSGNSRADLFSFIGGTTLESIEGSEKMKISNPRESHILDEGTESHEVSDSQPLSFEGLKSEYQSLNNQEDKVKRIVIFYESGRFESFEP